MDEQEEFNRLQYKINKETHEQLEVLRGVLRELVKKHSSLSRQTRVLVLAMSDLEERLHSLEGYRSEGYK